MTLRIEGVPSTFTWSSSAINIFREVNGDGRTITIDVVETDFAGDDHFDPPPVLRTLSDRGRTWLLGNFTDTACPPRQSYCTQMEARWNGN